MSFFSDAGKAVSKAMSTVESGLADGVSKLANRVELTGEGRSGTTKSGGKKGRTFESLTRDELLSWARDEMEASRKLKSSVKAAEALRQAVVRLLESEGGAEDVAQLELVDLAATLTTVWERRRRSWATDRDTAPLREEKDVASGSAEPQTAQHGLIESDALAELHHQNHVLRTQVRA